MLKEKKIDLSGVKEFFKNALSEKNLNIMRNFFMGKWYPIWVAFSVLIGRLTCLEVYFAMLDLAILSLALLVCDSIRPVLPNLITFLFRIPLEHSPGTPRYSDYYVTETAVKAVFVFFAIFIVALVCFYIKNKVFVGVNPLKTPLFIPLSLLSVSFLTAGIFSGNRVKEDFGFSLLQVLVFFVVYMILYYGLKKENVEHLFDYFAYIGAMCAVVLSLEVMDLFLRVDDVIVNGALYKSNIMFGWGISNTAGNALTMVAPLCILGAMRAEKLYKAVIYYGICAVTMLATLLTLSRSALLVGGVAIILCMIVACFTGRQKVFCRIALLCVAGIIFAAFMVFNDKILLLLKNVIDKGFDNNGRYRIWGRALKYYKDNPWFGNGHFALNVGVQNSTFTPRLAHNTLLQLLTAMGVFGLLSYLVYRVFSIIPFFKKITGYKLILVVVCGVLVFESLIDNFIFWFSPTFVYNICIVLALMHCEQTKSKKDLTDSDDESSVSGEYKAEAPEKNNTEMLTEGIVHDSPINDAPISTTTL